MQVRVYNNNIALKSWLFILSCLASTQGQLHNRQANSKMNRLVGIAVFLIVFLEIINAFPRNRAGKFLLALNFFGINFLSYLLNSRFKLHPCQPLQRSKQSSEGIWKFLFSEQFERNIMASKSLFPYQRFGGFLKNWLPQMFQNLSLLSKQLSLLKCPSRDKV